MVRAVWILEASIPARCMAWPIGMNFSRIPARMVFCPMSRHALSGNCSRAWVWPVLNESTRHCASCCFNVTPHRQEAPKNFSELESPRRFSWWAKLQPIFRNVPFASKLDWNLAPQIPPHLDGSRAKLRISAKAASSDTHGTVGNP